MVVKETTNHPSEGVIPLNLDVTAGHKWSRTHLVDLQKIIKIYGAVCFLISEDLNGCPVLTKIKGSRMQNSIPSPSTYIRKLHYNNNKP